MAELAGLVVSRARFARLRSAVRLRRGWLVSLLLCFLVGCLVGSMEAGSETFLMEFDQDGSLLFYPIPLKAPVVLFLNVFCLFVLFVCLFVCLYVCLLVFVCLCVCLFVCLSLLDSVCLLVCLFKFVGCLFAWLVS